MTKAAGEMVRDSSILDMPYRILVSAIALLSIGGGGRPIENIGQVLHGFQMPDYLSRDDSWLSLTREWIHAVPLLSPIAALLLLIGCAFMVRGAGPQGAVNLRAGSTAVLMFLLIWERSGFSLAMVLTLAFAVVAAAEVRVAGKVPGRFQDFFWQWLIAMMVAVVLDLFLLAVALYAAPRDAIGLYQDRSERRPSVDPSSTQ